jgi:hypothetical protein
MVVYAGHGRGHCQLEVAINIDCNSVFTFQQK